MPAPPAAGELRTALAGLAAKSWRHPISGLEVCFGASTLERWYYAARRAADAAIKAASPSPALPGYPVMPRLFAVVR